MRRRLIGLVGREAYGIDLKFYRTFPEIVPTPSAQFGAPLTWSHYEELLRVIDPVAREWYEREASAQTWSVRTLRRNVNTQYYVVRC